MGNAIVILIGKDQTVTAPQSQTPAHPASACCAVAGVTASAGFVIALKLEPMELPVRNAPPVPIPAL